MLRLLGLCVPLLFLVGCNTVVVRFESPEAAEYEFHKMVGKPEKFTVPFTRQYKFFRFDLGGIEVFKVTARDGREIWGKIEIANSIGVQAQFGEWAAPKIPDADIDAVFASDAVPYYVVEHTTGEKVVQMWLGKKQPPPFQSSPK